MNSQAVTVRPIRTSGWSSKSLNQIKRRDHLKRKSMACNAPTSNASPLTLTCAIGFYGCLVLSRLKPIGTMLMTLAANDEYPNNFSPWYPKLEYPRETHTAKTKTHVVQEAAENPDEQDVGLYLMQSSWPDSLVSDIHPHHNNGATYSNLDSGSTVTAQSHCLTTSYSRELGQ